jgi:hypothetical protein
MLRSQGLGHREEELQTLVEARQRFPSDARAPETVSAFGCSA